jgi:hypothetical protein
MNVIGHHNIGADERTAILTKLGEFQEMNLGDRKNRKAVRCARCDKVNRRRNEDSLEPA